MIEGQCNCVSLATPGHKAEGELAAKLSAGVNEMLGLESHASELETEIEDRIPQSSVPPQRPKRV